MKNKLLIYLFGSAVVMLFLHSCNNISNEIAYEEIMYRRKCSSCHNLIEPDRFDKNKWSVYIDKYGKKMTDEEKRLVLLYLTQ